MSQIKIIPAAPTKSPPTFFQAFTAAFAIFSKVRGFERTSLYALTFILLASFMGVGAWVGTFTAHPKTIIIPVEKIKGVEKIPEVMAAPVESIFIAPPDDVNPPDPAPAINVDKFNPKAYIAKFKNAAQQGMRKYGVPASISLAQGLIESRAGTSKLAVSNNNHFGMKCFARNCRKGHCTNHTDDTHKDFFLKFKNASLSWEAHGKLISTGRYAKLKKYGRDYRRWATGLKAAGYATDPTYAQKLIGVIERYKLYQYD